MKSMTRKSFLKMSGMGLGAAGLMMLTGCSSTSSSEESSSSAAEETSASTEETAAAGTELVETETEDEGGAAVAADGQRTYLACTGGSMTEIAPFTNSGAGNMQYRCIVYMKLAYWVGADMYSDCAESIEQVDDYSYRVTLYDGIYDSAGYSFDASDLVFCLNKIIEIGKISYHSQIESIEQEDDLTVLITLKTNAASAFQDMAQSTCLVTQESYEESADEMATDPVGFTQYEVTNFVASSVVRYEKVDDYWQKDESKISRHYEANVDVIEMYMVQEAAQKVAGLQTGTLQIASEVGQTNIDANFADNDDYYVDTELCPNDCMGIFFNMTSEGACADDLYLRQAILYAIDKQTLLDSAGLGVTSKDFSAYNFTGFNEDWLNEDYFDYDPEYAAELLAQSNYSGATIRILSSATDAYKTLTELIAVYLNAIGITTEIVIREAAAWTSATYASAQEYDVMIKGVGYASANITDCYKKVSSDSVSDVEGTTFFGWDNQEVIDLTNQIAAVNGFDQDVINEIHDLYNEYAIGMGLYCDYQSIVGVAGITDIWQLGTIYVANATHFDSSYAVYCD